MKKHLLLTALLVILFSLSCAISYEGIQFSDDPDPEEVAREQLLREMQEASTSEQPEQSSDVSPAEEKPNSESENQITAPGEAINPTGEKEYAVSATNFNCICSVDSPTRSVNLEINGDELTYAGEIYSKIAENTYKYSFMGYYILNSGEGENKTSTKVDEEHHSIIILTADGFVMEHYKGEESSPCCFHTFSLNE